MARPRRSMLQRGVKSGLRPTGMWEVPTGAWSASRPPGLTLERMNRMFRSFDIKRLHLAGSQFAQRAAGEFEHAIHAPREATVVGD